MKIKKSQLRTIINNFLSENVVRQGMSTALRALPYADDLPALFQAVSGPEEGEEEASSDITAESSSDAIKEVQRVLFTLRYNIGKSGPARNGIDGQFGSSTKRALKKFRSDHGLSADLPADRVSNRTALKMFMVLTPFRKVAAADDRRPPPRPALKSKEDIPLERSQGLPAVGEPYAIDPQISPEDEPWTTTAKQRTLTRQWDKVEPETKNFVSAMPAAMASLGVVDKKTEDGEAEAKQAAAGVISSIYRGPFEQARAMYTGPYRWELRIRKQLENVQSLADNIFGDDVPASGDNVPKPGDYYFSRTLTPRVVKLMDAALKAAGGRGFKKGVYRAGGWAEKVYDIFEKHTGGDLDNHPEKQSIAVEEATPIIAAVYEKNASGHAAGDSIDLTTRVYSQAQLAKIISRIEQISGVDFNVSAEADHFHISLAESIYDELYKED